MVHAPDLQTIQRLYGGQLALAAAAGSFAGPVAVPQIGAKAAAILNLVGSICAYVDSVGLIFFGTIKFAAPTFLPAVIAYTVSYLFYVAPSVTQFITEASNLTWDVIMNFVVTVVSVVKTFADIALYKFEKGVSGAVLTLWNTVSPAAEAFINVIWEAPVVMGLVRDQSAQSVVGFLGNTAFNGGGWITPGTAYPEDLRIRAAFLLATFACARVYGALALVQGVLVYTGA